MSLQRAAGQLAGLQRAGDRRPAGLAGADPAAAGRAVAGQVARRLRHRLRRAVARHRRPLAAGLLAAAVAAAVNAVTPGPAPAAPTQLVLVAAHDLPAGRLLRPDDVERRAWPVGAVPRGIQASAGGRVLASAIRAGEPITDARLTGPGLLTGQPAGTRAVTVRLSDPAAASIVRAGDRVDVLAGGVDRGGTSGSGRVGAASAAEVAQPGGQTAAGGGKEPAAGTGGQVGAEVVVEAAVVLGAPSDACGQGAETADPLAGLGGAGGPASGCPAGAAVSSGVLLLAVDGNGARRLAQAASVADRSLSVAIRR